jgi:hypothetical protein
MTKDALIEALAAIEHERWSDWQHYVQDERCRPELNMADRVSLVINADDAERWERQFQTPYADLSEREKQSDRDQVSRYWPLIVDFFERRGSVSIVRKVHVGVVAIATSMAVALGRKDMSA